MIIKLTRLAAAPAAALLMGAAPLVSTAPPDKARTIAEAERSVVRVIAIALDDYGQVGGVSLGSGFVVAPGKVVTNNHVIAVSGDGGETRVYVIPEADSGSERELVSVVKTWPEGDLALLSAPGLKAAPLPIATAVPTKDATVHALGYPGYTDQARNLPLSEILSPAEPYVTPGAVALVSRTAPGGGRFETIFHTAPVNRGNSGGPLIDACGRVIGVNTWAGALTVGDDGEVDLPAGQFAAVHASLLAGFLGGQGATVLPGPCLPPLSPAVEARFAALEGALADETKKREAAEKRLAAADRRARDWTTAGLTGSALLGLAALIGLFVRRPKAPPPPTVATTREPPAS